VEVESLVSCDGRKDGKGERGAGCGNGMWWLPSLRLGGEIETGERCGAEEGQSHL
jgi:hypothetical protein